MLVPVSAHLPMAHSASGANHDSSAMSPGTLMLANPVLRFFLALSLALSACSCGSPRSTLVVPTGDVFRQLNYGIPITDLKIDGRDTSPGKHNLTPGQHKVSFQVGSASYDLSHSFEGGRKYYLQCDQKVFGSTASLLCDIVERK